MLVVDLKETNRYEDEWKKTINLISQSSDKLKENYLSIDIEKFSIFPAVIEHDEIICFSGLQTDANEWGEKIGRVNARMWVHPNYRSLGLKKFTGGKSFLNSTYCLPLQISKARELGLDIVFISRQGNVRGFKEYLNLIKRNCNEDFKLDCHQYRIYQIDQHVATLNLTDNAQYTWLSSMTEFIV
jgi:hypothetical protein